jgi:hypothetical protein
VRLGSARCGASRRRCLVGRWGPCDSERRGGAGWAGRGLRPSGEGESGPIGEEGRWAVAGPKTRAGPKFKK